MFFFYTAILIRLTCPSALLYMYLLVILASLFAEGVMLATGVLADLTYALVSI